MTSKQDLRERLKARRERILTQVAREAKRSSAVLENLGFGYAMRAYSRLKHLSYAAADRLQERLVRVEAELAGLGWRNPCEPVEVERTPEEQLRHYCEVTGLACEEAMARIKTRETTHQGTFIAFISVCRHRSRPFIFPRHGPSLPTPESDPAGCHRR